MKSRLPLRLVFSGLCLGLSVRAAMPAEEMAALRARAESGDSIAQHNLGLKYADAKDSYYNIVDAYAWLSIAARNGATGNALGVVRSQLTGEQMSQADARTRTLIAQLRATSPDPVSAASPASDANANTDPVAPAAVAAPAADNPIVGAAENPVASAEFKRMSEELAAVWKENDQLKSELGQLRANAANFEGERNGLLQKIEAATKSGNSQQTEAAANELRTAKFRVAELENQLKAAKEQGAGSVETAKGLQEQVTKANTQIQSLQKQLADAGAQLKALQGEKSGQGGQVAKLQGQLDASAKQLAQAQDDLHKASDRADGLSKDLEQSRTALTSAGAAGARAASLETELATARKELEKLQPELAQLRANAANFEGERNGLLARIEASNTDKSQLQGSTEALKTAQTQLADAQSQLEQARQQAAASEQKVKDLDAQLATAKAAGEKASSAGSNQVAELQATLGKVQGDLEKARSEGASALEAAKAESEKQVAALSARTEELSQQLAAANKALSEATAKLTVAVATPAAPAVDPALPAQLEEAQLKLEASLRSFEMQGKEIDRLQKALTNVDAERDALAEQLKAQQGTGDTRVKELESQLADLKAQMASSSSAASATAADRGVLLERVNALESHNRLLEARVRDAEAKLAQANAAPAEPAPAAPSTAPEAAAANQDNAAPAETSDSSRDLASELKDAQSKLEVTLRSFQLQREEIDRLQKALADADADRSTLASRLQTAGGQVTDAQSQAQVGARAAAELDTLREQLRQTQNELAAVINERNSGRDRAAPAPLPPAGGALYTVPLRPSPSPAASTPAAAPTPTPQARIHVVVAGDTLSKIARRYLGDAERWAEIYELNRGAIRNPQALQVGTRLKLP